MERILASRSMARDVFILWDENSEDCATKRRMRHLRDSCTRSECSLGARPEQGCRQLALLIPFSRIVTKWWLESRSQIRFGSKRRRLFRGRAFGTALGLCWL